jgi:hypothetical protein
MRRAGLDRTGMTRARLAGAGPAPAVVARIVLNRFGWTGEMPR